MDALLCSGRSLECDMWQCNWTVHLRVCTTTQHGPSGAVVAFRIHFFQYAASAGVCLPIRRVSNFKVRTKVWFGEQLLAWFSVDARSESHSFAAWVRSFLLSFTRVPFWSVLTMLRNGVPRRQLIWSRACCWWLSCALSSLRPFTQHGRSFICGSLSLRCQESPVASCS